MNAEKLKKWIIILSIIIVIILVLLFFVIWSKRFQTPDSILRQEEENVKDSTIGYTEYNEVKYVHISDQQICNMYLLDYKTNMIKEPEVAYNSLDKEYREKRFGSFENYKSYILANQEKMQSIKLVRYQVVKDEENNRYICMDQYGNYYIFTELAIMKYSLILDTYTVALPEYIEKYNSSTQVQKAGMCIDRFIKAINDENYSFAYSLLSAGFKQNYFKAQASFVTYAKQNFYGRSQISYANYENEGELLKYNVELKNADNTLEKTFIIRFKEETDFEMSFNV